MRGKEDILAGVLGGLVVLLIGLTISIGLGTTWIAVVVVLSITVLVCIVTFWWKSFVRYFSLLSRPLVRFFVFFLRNYAVLLLSLTTITLSIVVYQEFLKDRDREIIERMRNSVMEIEKLRKQALREPVSCDGYVHCVKYWSEGELTRKVVAMDRYDEAGTIRRTYYDLEGEKLAEDAFDENMQRIERRYFDEEGQVPLRETYAVASTPVLVIFKGRVVEGSPAVFSFLPVFFPYR